MKIRPVGKSTSWPFAPLVIIAVLWLLQIVVVEAAQKKEDWEPIAPDDLAATECKAYPGSSAEILFFKQALDKSAGNEIAKYSRRVKIYNVNGTDAEGVLNIDYPSYEVWSPVARLTKPDGRQIVFERKDFTESLLEKSGSYRTRRLTLAVPDLGPGDIIEMRWTEPSGSALGDASWWYFQTNLPTRYFSLSLDSTEYASSLLAFNLPHSGDETPGSKRTKLEIRDIPPFVAEPFMPPVRDVRGWLMVLTTPRNVLRESKDFVWKNISKTLVEYHEEQTKVYPKMKAKADELVRGATTDEEKLRRLYDFCQEQISNFDHMKTGAMAKARKRLEDTLSDQTAEDTFTRKSGDSGHINCLFSALAKAEGFETRYALSASREATLNVKHPNGWVLMTDPLIAVRVRGAWQFYTPGNYFVPAGMLPVANEGATTLISDRKKIIYETNPYLPASQSAVRRIGRFTLDAEGMLEGAVEISLDGHAGVTLKQEYQDWLGEEIDTDYRTRVLKHLPGAVLSDLRWENLRDRKLPLLIRYKLTVPAYADKAGSAIVLPANVFEHGAPVIFKEATRTYPISFDFARSEHDDIEIRLPIGYGLDAGSAPPDIGDPADVVGVRYHIGYSAAAGKIFYKRDFALGANGALVFEVAGYPAFKETFDGIKRSDEHSFVLKPKPSAPVLEPVR